MNRLRLAVVFLVFCSVAGAQTAVPMGLTNIGVAAAVRGAVRATAPSQVGRVIGSGQPVYLNDHVTTGRDGRLQLLLLDQTTFTIGPNSDLVLDEFVYDPKTSIGKVSANILKGVFRFVTGKIAQRRPGNMRVTLPVGTIGIRGTMVAGRVDGRNATIALLGPGPDNNGQERPGGITVFNAFGHTNVNASGYGVTILDGGKPSGAYRFNAAQLDGILNELGVHHTAGTGGPGDASGNSGDQLAQGGINYRDWENLNEFNQGVNQTSGFASQQVASGCNGADCWSDLLLIPSGTSGYQGSGTFTCAGSGCLTALNGYSGTYQYGINVNFGSRTIGGDGISYIQLTAGLTDNANINTINFGSNGRATYTLSSTDAVGSSGNFGGTTLTFLKTGGQPAGGLQVNMIYNATYAGTGTATGSTSVAPRGAAIPGT